MPQLDVSTFTSQLFWLCVCFFSMLFIMSRFIVPKIAEVVEQRRHRIDGYLEKATLLKQQAEDALEKYQVKIKDANLKSDKLLTEATQNMNILIAQRQKELQDELNKKISQAEKQIIKAKNEAKLEVNKIAEDLVATVLDKINVENITKKEIKNFVSSEIAGLKYDNEK